MKIGKLGVMVALAAGICGGQPDGRGVQTESRAPVLTIFVASFARLEQEKFQMAVQIAQDRFGRAGVSIKLVTCPVERSDGFLRPKCPAPIERSHVFFRIIERPGAKEQVSPGLMAYAVPGKSGRYGTTAYVYWARVADLASSEHFSPSTVLGHVIAHEIGHLLGLPHSSAGVMSPSWGRSQLIQMEKGHLKFAPEETRRMQSMLDSKDDGD